MRTPKPLLVHSVALIILVSSGACGRGDAPAPDARTAVWLDLSPAIGDPPRDPGDALALLQAYGSGRLQVRGVSVTFGNAPLVRGYPAAQELLQRLDSGLLRAWRGASTPEERGAATEATVLLEEALGKHTLTIVATGPATTIASVLLRQPEMADRIDRVILVAGTRPDMSAASTTSPDSGDVNVRADAGSLQVLLDSRVALTLIAAGPMTKTGLDATDLDRLDTGRGPVKLITPSARGWLEVVKRRDGVPAFPIPAMLAVDVAAHPGSIRCEAAVARVEPARAEGQRLIVTDGPAGRAVTWCHLPDAGARDRMIADVLRVGPRAR